METVIRIELSPDQLKTLETILSHADIIFDAGYYLDCDIAESILQEVHEALSCIDNDGEEDDYEEERDSVPYTPLGI